MKIQFTANVSVNYLDLVAICNLQLALNCQLHGHYFELIKVLLTAQGVILNTKMIDHFQHQCQLGVGGLHLFVIWLINVIFIML